MSSPKPEGPRKRAAVSSRRRPAQGAPRADGIGGAGSRPAREPVDSESAGDESHETHPEILEPEVVVEEGGPLAALATPVDLDSDPATTTGADGADERPEPRLAPSANVRETRISALRDPVGAFLAEARRHPRLSEEEERALGRAVRERGDREAARRLVIHNLRLVVAIAYQYRRAWANILDLFQEGSVGLMEAVKRWEPALGPRFGSYAAYWIRAYVLRFLMTNSRLIHVGNTRAGRKLFFRLERERQKLVAAGFEPTPKLLAARLDVDEKELDEVRQHLESREVSMEPRGGGDADEGYSLAERIPIEQASPEQQAAATEMGETLHGFMAAFHSSLTDERERVIWQEHLAAEEPVPLGELGARFGVSKQRMGQIADKLKRRFRDEIVAKLGPDIRTAWLGERD